MIFGTEGHIADGTSEKPTPRTSIAPIATSQWFSSGIANSTWVSVISPDPTSMMVAPRPCRS